MSPIDVQSGILIVDWDKIIKGVEYLQSSGVARIDGPAFKIYWVGDKIIRIDLEFK